MRLRIVFVCVVAASMIVGCIRPMFDEHQLSEKVAQSPIVANPEQKLPVRRTPEAVELYYRVWSGWNRPGLLNWEEHCIVGKGSTPTKNFREISEFDIFTSSKNDEVAKKKMTELASQMGGDGVIDIYRYPITAERALPAKIIGYRYRATIIRYIP